MQVEPNKITDSSSYLTYRDRCGGPAGTMLKEITPSTAESQQELSKTNKHFWNFIMHKKQDAQSVAPLKRDGVLTDDAQQKANILNQQFQSVFFLQLHF